MYPVCDNSIHMLVKVIKLHTILFSGASISARNDVSRRCCRYGQHEQYVVNISECDCLLRMSFNTVQAKLIAAQSLRMFMLEPRFAKYRAISDDWLVSFIYL